jgi:hypothetical protein
MDLHSARDRILLAGTVHRFPLGTPLHMDITINLHIVAPAE